MTKQELMENYTMEQLADRIIGLEKFFTGINIFNSLQSEIQSPLEKSIADNYEEQIKQKDEKIIKLENQMGEFENQRDSQITRVNELKRQLDRKETEINQIDNILNELFGVTHDVTSKPDEFKEILRDKIDGSKAIADFLPTEPIKVADILISSEKEYELNPLEKAFSGTGKGTCNLFDVSELKQIAEHLLIYCNANMEA